MLDLSITNCIYLGWAKKAQPNQKMYGKRPLCSLDGLRFRPIHLDSEGCNFIMPFDQSSPTCSACKMLNRSTMSSRRLAVFKDDRWIRLFKSVSHRAILLEVPGRTNQFYQEFLKSLHNRTRKQHEIKHLEYRQMTRQSFCIWVRIQLLCLGWFYRVSSKERGMKLHSRKIWYRLRPIYRQRMSHFTAVNRRRIGWPFKCRFDWIRKRLYLRLSKLRRIRIA